MATLRRYILRCKTKIKCSLCYEVLLPKEMKKHYRMEHGLRNAKCCIWCNGAYTWEYGTKDQQEKHIAECFENAKLKRAIENNEMPRKKKSVRKENIAETTLETEIKDDIKPIFDITPMCPERNFFGHDALAPPEAYEHINPPPHQWKENEPLPQFTQPRSELTFTGNIQIANDYVQIFLGTSRYRWYHAMVSISAMPSFLNAMKPYPSKVFTLPFWCWCNGGSYSDPYKRQHRHMIIASEGDCFIQRVWPHVAHPKDQNKPRNYQCKRYKKIESWMHLVNTIGYVSKQQSKCQFSFVNEHKVKAKNQHFYIATSLPQIFNYCIATQVGDNALLEILKIHFRPLSPDPFLHKVFKENQSWHIRIKDIVKHLYTVLPVEKHWEPFIHHLPWNPPPSNTYMHLLNGDCLYFVKNQNIVDWPMEQWIQYQMERGNSFCKAIGHYSWKFSANQQKTLNTVHYVREQNDQAMNRLKIERSQQVQLLIDQVHLLHEKNESLNNQNKSLTEKNELLTNQIKQLEEFKIYLKGRALTGDELAGRELKRLTEEVNRLKEELKQRNEELKQRNEENRQLKNRLGLDVPD